MKRVFVFLIIVCASLFVFAWISISKTINTPIAASTVPTEYGSLNPADVSFTSADGNKLSGWYFKVTNPKAVVIVVHGLSDTTGGKADMIGHVKYLNDAGYSAFLIDLRGFGESEFRPISFATQEWKDAEAAYYTVKKYPENAGKPVGFLGHSMGGATAIIASGRAHAGDFIIADVPFASAPKFLRKQTSAHGLPFMYPFVTLAARLQLGSEYSEVSAEQYISQAKVPLLVIGAKRDQAVDPQDAEDLYNAATTTTKKLWMADTSHNTYGDNPMAFEYQVLTFLNSLRANM